MKKETRIASPLAFAALAAVLLVAEGARGQPASLRGYGVDIDQTSVSGISSGGAMAVQMHVAHSSIMRGVGITAGLAYDCVDSSVHSDEKRLANVAKCMEGEIPAAKSKERAEAADDENAIDSLDHLSTQRVWILHGSRDQRVDDAAIENLAEFYRHYVDASNLSLVTLPNAAHAQITDNFGAHCPDHDEFYISNCDFDSAGEMLKHIYGAENLHPQTAGELSGTIQPFDQSAFVDGDPRPYGLATTGYLYVPRACERNGSGACRVHVVFHGCKQSVDMIGQEFIEHSGYNEWADTNKIIVLYPQLTPIPPLGYVNLEALDAGCWDWFGYSGYDVNGHYDSNYPTKRGFQISAIRRMLDCLARESDQSC